MARDSSSSNPSLKETSNQPGGREGSGTPKKIGPAASGGTLKTNKTMSGGINRATRKG